MKQRLLNKLKPTGLLLSALLAVVFLLPSPGRAQTPRDCDDNAVIRCGAYTVTELRSKMTGDVPTIFAHYGITDSDFDSMVDGVVKKDGTVMVGDKVVATNAISTGRQDIPGSTFVPSIGVYERPPSVSFRSDALAAFVKITNDQFEFAIIKSCGNPIKAVPVAPPPTPPPPAQPPPPAPPPEQPKPPKVTPPKPPELPPAPPARVVQPRQLTVTGPDDLIGIFAATSIGGFLAHTLVNRWAYRLGLRS